MEDQEDRIFVFLDSQVFYKYNYEWSHPIFVKLREHVISNNVQLLTTSIVSREIDNGIKESLNQAKTILNSAMKKISLLRSLRSSKVFAVEELVRDIPKSEELIRRKDAFFADLAFVHLEYAENSFENLFNMYFSGEAPFGTKSKKSEFPDAANYLALMSYAEKIKQSIFVVSDDGDWARLIGKTEILKVRTDLGKFIEELFEKEENVRFGPEKDRILRLMNRNEEKTRDFFFEAILEASIVNDGDGEIRKLVISQITVKEISIYDKTAEFGKITYDGEVVLEVLYRAEIALEDIETEVSGKQTIIPYAEYETDDIYSFIKWKTVINIADGIDISYKLRY